ncbi:MAG: hypothetical protein ABIG56_04195 [Candidatus Omnitrophota bacterium]
MFKFLILSVNFVPFLLFSPVHYSFAQEEPKVIDSEQMRLEMEQRQQEELERLKELDPDAYKQMKESIERSSKINELLSLYRQGRISLSQAKKLLYPLVEENLQAQINNIDFEIEKTEKKLNYLNKIKGNPKYLIEERVDMLLGERISNLEDILF